MDSVYDNAYPFPRTYRRTYYNPEQGFVVEYYGNTLTEERRNEIMKQRGGTTLDCVTQSCTCPHCGEELRCEETVDEENKLYHCRCPEH